MDALEFLKEYCRMCDSVESCSACPLSQTSYDSACDFAYMAKHAPETLVRRVEQWSKGHPIVTNAMKFEEVFGRPPKYLSGDWYCPPIVTEPCVGADCNMCRRWWEEPYKEQTAVKGGEV